MTVAGPTARDLARFATLRGMGAAARMLPPAAYPGWSGLAAALPARFKARAQVAKIHALFPDGFGSGPQAERLPRKVLAHRFEEMMAISRLRRHPDWRPVLRVRGLEALDAAHARGGIMLWVCPLRFNMLLTSIALHDAGCPAIRLSHWTHGPAATDTPTDWAQARINRPWQAVENTYATRLEIGPGSVRKPMAAFSRHLRDGGLALVNAFPLAVNPATRRVPNGVFRLAGGAARAAFGAGAEIWTSVLRRRADAGFDLDLAPLNDGTAPLDLETALTLMARRSHAAIAADPTLWVIASPQLEPEAAT